MKNPVKLDAWVKDVLVDPLSKEPLTADDANGFLVAPYGRKYAVRDGICDLRLLNNETTPDQKVWREGQLEYVRWFDSLVVEGTEKGYRYEIEAVRQVYEDIPIEGSCLDVGGSQGRLRQFLSASQPYVACDPIPHVFGNLDKQPNLLKVFPFLQEPVNFICCDAEFLPFASSCFDTVHMRSVIDHFLSPELALNEAYRVLRSDGVLIVGLFVEGGKRGKRGLKVLAKESIKSVLVAAGMKRFKDYHVWHPSFVELTTLISDCGFGIDKVHWQKGFNDRVCYVRARKLTGLTRKAANV